MSALSISNELLYALLPILVCPHTKLPLYVVDVDTLAHLNHDIAAGAIHTVSQALWGTPLEMVLTEASGTYFYPVIGGIFCFLDDYALQRRVQPVSVAALGETQMLQAGVRHFYDSVGWESQDNTYVDAQIYEDTRPIVADYVARSHKRLQRYLPKDGGTFILDAASGPVQYPEYLAYHEHFRWRICLDFSVQALRQAQLKLGPRGVYVLADLTCLPFADSCMDAVISLHTIYHIPASLQRQAFLEIYRVLAPERSAVVVYGWGNHSPIKRLGILHLQALWFWQTIWGFAKRQSNDVASAADFYVHFHSWDWFENQKWPFKLKVFQWRTLDPEVTKIWIRPFLFGKQVLAWLADIEDKHPEELALAGAFPAFVIEKPASAPASE
jgi:SAM-dependent methyltransferase/uncharacterized protein YbaR (Trm112 family)